MLLYSLSRRRKGRPSSFLRCVYSPPEERVWLENSNRGLDSDVLPAFARRREEECNEVLHERNSMAGRIGFAILQTNINRVNPRPRQCLRNVLPKISVSRQRKTMLEFKKKKRANKSNYNTELKRDYSPRHPYFRIRYMFFYLVRVRGGCVAKAYFTNEPLLWKSLGRTVFFFFFFLSPSFWAVLNESSYVVRSRALDCELGEVFTVLTCSRQILSYFRFSAALMAWSIDLTQFGRLQKLCNKTKKI